MENIDVNDDTLERFWVLVADSNTARVLHGVSPRADLQEFYRLENEDGRKAGSEIDTDGPGSRRDVGHKGSGPGDPKTGQRSSMPADPVEQAKKVFAGRVADWLDHQRAKDRFDRLSIIAAPKFLGELRNKMSDALEAKVLEEIDKNLTSQPLDTIRDTLQRLND